MPYRRWREGLVKMRASISSIKANAAERQFERQKGETCLELLMMYEVHLENTKI